MDTRRRGEILKSGHAEKGKIFSGRCYIIKISIGGKNERIHTKAD